MAIVETPVETLCPVSHTKEICYVRRMDFEGIQNYFADFQGCDNYNGSPLCGECRDAIMKQFPRGPQ